MNKPLLLYDSNDDRMNESVLNKNKFSINAIYYLYESKLLFIGTGNNEETMYNSVLRKIKKLKEIKTQLLVHIGKKILIIYVKDNL